MLQPLSIVCSSRPLFVKLSSYNILHKLRLFEKPMTSSLYRWALFCNCLVDKYKIKISFFFFFRKNKSDEQSQYFNEGSRCRCDVDTMAMVLAGVRFYTVLSECQHQLPTTKHRLDPIAMFDNSFCLLC